MLFSCAISAVPQASDISLDKNSVLFAESLESHTEKDCLRAMTEITLVLALGEILYIGPSMGAEYVSMGQEADENFYAVINLRQSRLYQPIS
ncbi:hypothetical protein KT99_17291 [Shewanella benthica KT99]|uniref:Uncharacterized protein n=2 Tax=Shewanella benthica TaxID=43661 RepID=A9D5W2_9GAMM|nr:hypothetical protein KT99_17291 [Shewanella benthica KT99]